MKLLRGLFSSGRSRYSSGRSLHRDLGVLAFLLLVEAADREVVHHLLHLLEVVLDGVEPLPQVVILQVQQTEPGV